MKLAGLLRYYEKKTGASISMEVLAPAFYLCDSLKLAPDQYLHHTDFCRAAKLADGNASCSRNKARSLQIARLGRSFCGACSHGVREYAFPFMYNRELCAIIYFGNPPQRPFSDEKRVRIRAAAAFISTFLKIELDLFLASGGMSGKQHGEDFYVENCRRYIDSHYQENVGLTDLADMLKVNPNYLGALIRRKTGKTFRRMLTERRISESKIYLKLHPHLSVTAVAGLCGFSDSNYFITVFRRFCGMTPLEFKRSADI